MCTLFIVYRDKEARDTEPYIQNCLCVCAYLDDT